MYFSVLFCITLNYFAIFCISTYCSILLRTILYYSVNYCASTKRIFSTPDHLQSAAQKPQISPIAKTVNYQRKRIHRFNAGNSHVAIRSLEQESKTRNKENILFRQYKICRWTFVIHSNFKKLNKIWNCLTIRKIFLFSIFTRNFWSPSQKFARLFACSWFVKAWWRRFVASRWRRLMNSIKRWSG